MKVSTKVEKVVQVLVDVTNGYNTCESVISQWEDGEGIDATMYCYDADTVGTEQFVSMSIGELICICAALQQLGLLSAVLEEVHNNG